MMAGVMWDVTTTQAEIPTAHRFISKGSAEIHVDAKRTARVVISAMDTKLLFVVLRRDHHAAVTF